MPRHLELDVLRSFVAVAESGGFRRAAVLRNLTQPAITQHIQRLEAQLGVPLLRRGRGGAVLTEQGEELLADARRLLALNDQAIGRLSRHRPAAIRFGTIDDVAQGALPAILEAFAAASPGVSVAVQVDASDALYRKLDGGELDLVVAARTASRVKDEGLRREPLAWLASRDLALDRSEPLPVVLCGAPCRIRDAVIEALGAARMAFRIVATSPNLAGLLAAVEAGLGVTARGAGLARGPTIVLDDSIGLPPLPALELVLSLRGEACGAGAETLARIVRGHFASIEAAC